MTQREVPPEVIRADRGTKPPDFSARVSKGCQLTAERLRLEREVWAEQIRANLARIAADEGTEGDAQR